MKDHKLNKLVREGFDPEEIDEYYAEEVEILEAERRANDEE